MDLQIGLEKILKKGILSNELEFKRASVMDRQLRLLVKEHPEMDVARKQLRGMLKAYEDRYWVNTEITDKQVAESDSAGVIAERENSFNIERKQLIKLKLKELGLSQKELGIILGHNSETYMSELINGIAPFTITDLVVIHKLLHISLNKLIPTTLTPTIAERVSNAISKLSNKNLQFDMGY